MAAEGWTGAADLKAQASRLWERGEIVRATLPRPSCESGESGAGTGAERNLSSDASPETLFPRRLRLRRPASRDLATRFEAVRAWVREIEALDHVRIERRTVRHAELGTNTLPDALWLDGADAAAALADRSRALARCREVAARLLEHDARLLDWAHRRPLALLDVAADLDRLLAVHARMQAFPRPGIYLREIDVPGVDGKFVETHRGLLADWLDLTLPEDAIDRTHRGARGFARRYGYRDKPTRLRMRSLDPGAPLIEAAGPGRVDLAAADLSLDADSAARLSPVHERIVITENEVNFLTLPPLPGTLALFGAGYGFAELGAIDWLGRRDVLYWGDLDTNGFAILDELRGVLPLARSVLMDRETLLAHRASWGTEPAQRRGRLTRLDEAEARLHAELLDGVHGDRVRLEQERIGHGWAVARLRAATSGSADSGPTSSRRLSKPVA